MPPHYIMERVVETAIVRSMFGQNDISRRSFMGLVGGTSFAAALASVFPVDKAKAAMELTSSINNVAVTVMKVEFHKRRDVISKRIQQINGMHMPTPGGAFYAFPSYEHDIASTDLALQLAKEGLICSPGSAFGHLGEHHLRFSYACGVEDIHRGMDILERVMDTIPIREERKSIQA